MNHVKAKFVSALSFGHRDVLPELNKGGTEVPHKPLVKNSPSTIKAWSTTACMPKANKSFKSKISILIISSSTFLAGNLVLSTTSQTSQSFSKFSLGQPAFKGFSWGVSPSPPVTWSRPKPLDILIQKHHHARHSEPKWTAVGGVDGMVVQPRPKQLRTFGQHRSKKFSDWQISNL